MKFKLNFRRKKKGEDEALDAADDAAATEAATGDSPAAAKSSGEGAKAWLFLHVEKLVLAGVLVLLGLLVYGALGKLELNRGQAPQDLEAKVQQINSRIESSEWNEDDYPVPDFKERVDTAQRPVGADDYTFKSLAGPSTVAIGKRTEPKFLPARDLEVAGGNGVFWLARRSGLMEGQTVVIGAEERKPLPAGFVQRGVRPEKDGAITEGRTWVSINALVPQAAQQNEYLASFADALGFNAQRDVPRYIGTRIRRLEVAAGSSAAGLDWNKAKTWSFGEWMSVVSQQRSTWATAAPEMADPRLSTPALAKSLGPLMFKSWKPWATHSQIPFAKPKPKRVARVPNRPGAVVRRPNGPEPAAAVAAPVDPELGIFDDPDAPKEPADEDPVVEDEPGDEPVDKEPEPAPVTDFRLVRVFDFTAEPGKNYRYQIQLALWNPNRPDGWKPPFNGPPVPARIMANPAVMLKGTFRESAWSDASAIVQVPTVSQVFADRILPPNEALPEQTAVVVAQILDVPNGRVPAGSFQLRRGAVADGTTTILQEDVVGKQAIIGTGALNTGMILLDMRGGQDLAGGVKAPAELLFLDPKGNLIFRESESDRAEVKSFRQLEGTAAEKRVVDDKVRPKPLRPEKDPNAGVNRLLEEAE